MEQGAGHDQTDTCCHKPFQHSQCCLTANETSNLKVCEEVYRKMELSLFRCKLFQNLFENPFYLDFLIQLNLKISQKYFFLSFREVILGQTFPSASILHSLPFQWADEQAHTGLHVDHCSSVTIQALDARGPSSTSIYEVALAELLSRHVSCQKMDQNNLFWRKKIPGMGFRKKKMKNSSKEKPCPSFSSRNHNHLISQG